MSFLLNKRRAAVAALVALLGATALFLGAGAAAAAPPNTSACRTDGFGDATVDVPGVLYATVDTFAVGNPGAQAFWVCLVPPDVGAGVDSHDPNPATPGLGYEVKACATPVGIPCGTVLGTTGAEVDAPVGTPNAPGGGDGTGGVAKEPGVCVYADGSTLTCPPPGRALAEVTVAEGDLPDVHTEPGCVNVNGTCQAPTVDGARVTVFGDTANETVYVDTIVGGTSDEHGSTCVGVDDPCP